MKNAALPKKQLTHCVAVVVVAVKIQNISLMIKRLLIVLALLSFKNENLIFLQLSFNVLKGFNRAFKYPWID